jgi:hypothetical protein
VLAWERLRLAVLPHRKLLAELLGFAPSLGVYAAATPVGRISPAPILHAANLVDRALRPHIRHLFNVSRNPAPHPAVPFPRNARRVRVGSSACSHAWAAFPDPQFAARSNAYWFCRTPPRNQNSK